MENDKFLKQNDKFFKQWLVGLTDGDGCFYIGHNSKGYWNFAFKISLSIYNLQVLHYIKKNLGGGSITIETSKKMGTFRIRDIKMLRETIIPIFETYPLLTSKFYSYTRFKNAISVIDNDSLTKSEKNSLVFQTLATRIDKDFVSPIWLQNCTIPRKEFLKLINLHNLTKDVKYIYNLVALCDLKLIISKPWLIGFIEAEGSFYLINKDNDRIVHGFGITQKLDPILLCGIRSFFGISAQIRYRVKHNYYILDNTNSRANENIITFFSGKNRSKTNMKSMKSVEFRIWSRSYFRYKGNYEKLDKIRDFMRKLKKT
ncbi:hypothetical protein ACKKBG_M90145 (mitochondrion) [Auxenochlorella protothecoides x Auxenochlorella symbiontica]